MSRPLRLGVLNVVLANGGDAAILLGLVRTLREAFGPDVKLTVFDAHAGATAPLYPELDVRPSPHLAVWAPSARGPAAKLARWTRWGLGRPRHLRAAARGEGPLAGLDVVVSTGGTYLTGTYWLGPRLFEFDLVRAAGLPYTLHTQSVGPFESSPPRLAEVFAGARAVLLRDARSEATVRSLAPEAATAVRADAAFALAEAGPLAEAARRTVAELPRVAVSVREWPYAATPHYHEAVRAAVAHLVRERGAEVVFASTCQGNAAYRYDDGAVAEEVAQGLPPDVRERVTVERGYFRPEALMDLYARCDLVLATRMHAAILALSAGTPAVPIAYEFKTEALYERLGRADWTEHIETTTPETMTAAVERALAVTPEARADLFARVDAMRRDALGAADLLRTAFADVAPASGAETGAPPEAGTPPEAAG